MQYSNGVISVLQPPSFGLPSVTFETFNSIVVLRHIWLYSYSFSLLHGMTIHDFTHKLTQSFCKYMIARGHSSITRRQIVLWPIHYSFTDCGSSCDVLLLIHVTKISSACPSLWVGTFTYYSSSNSSNKSIQLIDNISLSWHMVIRNVLIRNDLSNL